MGGCSVTRKGVASPPPTPSHTHAPPFHPPSLLLQPEEYEKERWQALVAGEVGSPAPVAAR